MEIKRSADNAWGSLSAKLFCVGFFAILLYILFKYALAAFIPFIIAYIVSLVINPLSRATARVTGIPRKLCAAIYVTLTIAAIFVAGAWCVNRLFCEIEEFVIGEGGGSVLGEAIMSVSDMLGRLSSRGLDGMGDKLYAFVAEIEKNAVNYISSVIGRLISGVVSHASSVFIGGVVTVMFCYYFSVDGDALSGQIKKAIPKRYRERVGGVISLMGTALKRYVKAYLLLMLITFCEVYVGLLILGVKYALLIALGVAVVDILPILGAGSVLVPWAAVCFFGGDVRLGLGLIILYGVVTVIRQIAEPAVVGTSIGLHPALSLFSMYMGFKLFGLFGMILGPCAAFVLVGILKQGSGEKIKSRTQW